MLQLDRISFGVFRASATRLQACRSRSVVRCQFRLWANRRPRVSSPRGVLHPGPSTALSTTRSAIYPVHPAPLDEGTSHEALLNPSAYPGQSRIGGCNRPLRPAGEGCGFERRIQPSTGETDQRWRRISWGYL